MSEELELWYFAACLFVFQDFSNSNPEKHVHQFFAAILEYMLSDVLKLTANYVQNISQNVVREEINVQDVKVAMFADKVS